MDDSITKLITLKNPALASWVFHSEPRIGGSFKILNSMTYEDPSGRVVSDNTVHQVIDALWLPAITPTTVRNIKPAIENHIYTDEDKHRVLEVLC
jgi:hypothetical protein